MAFYHFYCICTIGVYLPNMNVALILGYGIGFIKALLIEKQLDDRFTREFTPFVAVSATCRNRKPCESQLSSKYFTVSRPALEIDQL